MITTPLEGEIQISFFLGGARLASKGGQTSTQANAKLPFHVMFGHAHKLHNNYLVQSPSNGGNMKQKVCSLTGLLFAVAMSSVVQAQAMCPDGSYVSKGPCSMCPNGKYVGNGAQCQMTPNGGYVEQRSNASPQMTPNGRYVSGGSRPIMCPDGSYVTGTRCVMAPNGKYVGK